LARAPSAKSISQCTSSLKKCVQSNQFQKNWKGLRNSGKKYKMKCKLCRNWDIKTC
jgi:hypothetical protein